MWTCETCQQRLEDSFDVCWNCGTSREGIADPTFEAEPDVPASGASARPAMDCLRCGTELDFVGSRDFHQGARWGVFGDLGELFVKTQRFEIFVCPSCGHVEFFV